MKKISDAIVFFGSGPLAAKSLKMLTEHFEVEAVITKPKPEHHSGVFPVIEIAQELGLRILYAKNKHELSSLIKSSQLQSCVGLVIDYGIIISRDVIDYFKYGIVNSHFSLLPRWRGADPISFAILSGDTKTGVSLMLITEGLDEGPLLAQAPYPITPTLTTPELTQELVNISDSLIANVLPMYLKGELKPMSQSVTLADSSQPTYSRKLTKEDGRLDWQKTAEELERQIRAFIEWPKSRAIVGGLEVIVVKAKANKQSAPPGSAIVDGKRLLVGTAKGCLEILELKLPGKPLMSTSSFLAGYREKLKN